MPIFDRKRKKRDKKENGKKGMGFSEREKKINPLIENSHPRGQNIFLFLPVAAFSLVLTFLIGVMTLVTVLISY